MSSEHERLADEIADLCDDAGCTSSYIEGLFNRYAALRAASVKAGEPCAWIDFADSGNVRLWTSEKGRAAAEMAAGRKMTPVYTTAPTASVGVSVQKAIEEAAHLASLHAHHALWRGLLPYGWDAATEQFGRNLANAIAKAIKSEVPKRLAAANQSDDGVEGHAAMGRWGATESDAPRAGIKPGPSDTPSAPQAVEAVSVDDIERAIIAWADAEELELTIRQVHALARAILAEFKMEER